MNQLGLLSIKQRRQKKGRMQKHSLKMLQRKRLSVFHVCGWQETNHFQYSIEFSFKKLLQAVEDWRILVQGQ